MAAGITRMEVAKQNAHIIIILVFKARDYSIECYKSRMNPLIFGNL